jgi:BlaI family transcriptional regulator, penicillinase repressor
MPAHDKPDVTDAELGVLRVLWDDGPSTIRQLTDKLYPAGGTSHYATVQKLLDRLEQKGCVARNRSSMTHVFAASVAREVFVGDQVRAVAERLCGGAIAPVLTHLLRTETLSEDDRKELRKLLNAPRPKLN